MISEKQLIEKLLSIERLYAGATTPGERDAAASAYERIRERLKEAARTDPAVEYKFTMSDPWSCRLFMALLRRYNLKPYRYSGQRYTTVMTRVPESFVDQTLWPEFQALQETLRTYLNEVTNKVIAEAICADSSEAEEVADPATRQLN